MFSVDWQEEGRGFVRCVRVDSAAPTTYDLELWAGSMEPLLIVPKVDEPRGTAVLSGELPDVWFGYLDDLAAEKRDQWLATSAERGWDERP